MTRINIEEFRSAGILAGCSGTAHFFPKLDIICGSRLNRALPNEFFQPMKTSTFIRLLALGLTTSAFICPNIHAGCLTPPSGIVAWWDGEGNANDRTGTNNGTIIGGVTFAPGEVGQAFAFDGTTGYVDTGDALDMGQGDFTIEVWIDGDPRMDNGAALSIRALRAAIASGGGSPPITSASSSSNQAARGMISGPSPM
jgi:hypothetical protein